MTDAKPNIVFLESVDSTNNYIKRVIKEELICGDIAVVASEQTAGRGRLGRVWQSKKGDSLCMSIGIKCDYTDGFTLLAALGVYEALRSFCGDKELLVKWPNDIICDGKKLCGILCERVGDYTIIGIGINVNNEIFSDDIIHKATSLFLMNGKKNDVKELSVTVLSSVIDVLEYNKGSFNINAKERYCSLCANLGKEVTTLSDKGIACGISDSGSLIIKTDSGFKMFSSGEVAVHGIY